MKHVELLAPAGSFEGLKLAIDAGADAVYLGGTRFGARAYAKNCGEDELCSAIDYVHLRGKKLYLTVNTLMKEEELKNDLIPYLTPYYRQGLDAVIVQDLGVVSLIRNAFPDLAIHASTQMSITSLHGIRTMERHGVSRVVPAREISLKEIRAITSKTDVELECFIHGAMCFCYSGQCLMSSMLGGRSGNRGRCAQPCRLPYTWEGQTCYPLSLRDLLTLEILPELVDAGIASFKIEGRMKQPAYTAGVTGIYRKYLDLIENDQPFSIDPADKDRLQRLYSRSGSGSGYYKCRNGASMLTFDKPCYESDTEQAIEPKRCTRPVRGTAKLVIGKPAVLSVRSGPYRVSVQSGTVTQALQHPLTEAQIRERLLKTGNTPFSFETLDIYFDEQAYLSVKALNELRRKALDALSEKILSGFRRQQPDRTGSDFFSHPDPVTQPDPPGHTLSVLVTTKEQLLEVNTWEEVSRIYVESEIWADLQRNTGKSYYLALPYVYRPKRTDACGNPGSRPGFGPSVSTYLSEADGLLIRNIDELDLPFNGPRVADAGLYSANSKARAWLASEGISEDTLPLEETVKELKQRKTEGSEQITYGFIPLMVTAQCLHNQPLTDRYGTVFQTRAVCEHCYNLIYNSVPVYTRDICLTDRERLCFTTETIEEMRLIRQGIRPEQFTRGHLRRGVE